MPPRAIRPRGDVDCMVIVFAEGIDGENQMSRYHKLFKRDILATRYPDNAALRDLGLSDSIHWMLSNLVNPTPFLFAYFQSTYARTGGPICVGGLITYIALALNLDTELAMLEPLETPFADLDYFRSMRLIKNKPNDKYFLMISNREVRGVTLPCALINVRMSANWTFDLTAPEPDHTEQDAPHTGTHAPIAPAFPDSFVGTSSKHQPHEEYDYTARRITLDDVLSKLRHRNDAEEDRDVLLRNIQMQQEKMRASIDQIRQTQLDFVERTNLHIANLIDNMNEVHMEVAGMREYVQYVPNPAFGRGGFARHRGRDRYH
ncbi:hypothetical protein KIW84_034733 [Lathyrus oleraceus]|uniref:Uncharacterized protein n=1 Tax=Pisum sativum TaxID=3888 RepID=A0A9D4Y069_PEA|nr:hypothetical protein KIW84_034733 [Pisum sativum]